MVDRAINEICILLECSRHNLNVVSFFTMIFKFPLHMNKLCIACIHNLLLRELLDFQLFLSYLQNGSVFFGLFAASLHSIGIVNNHTHTLYILQVSVSKGYDFFVLLLLILPPCSLQPL